MHLEKDIYDLASRQGGVVRRDQAIQLGYSIRQIDRRVNDKKWDTVANGGYRLIDLSEPLDRVRAAVAVLPNATVSHYSAGALHAIARVDHSIASVTVHAKTTHAFPGTLVFRNRDLAPEHITTSRGLPVTRIERTVVDLAAELSLGHLGVIVDELLAQRKVGISELEHTMKSVARRGKPGITNLRTILAERSGGDERASRLEKMGMRLLTNAGIEGGTTEFPIPWAPHRRFDVAFPEARVAIEWDSIRWHTQLAAFQNDRQRDREAVLHGWRILRFTWQNVHDAPDMVIDTIRAVLAD